MKHKDFKKYLIKEKKIRKHYTLWLLLENIITGRNWKWGGKTPYGKSLKK